MRWPRRHSQHSLVPWPLPLTLPPIRSQFPPLALTFPPSSPRHYPLFSLSFHLLDPLISRTLWVLAGAWSTKRPTLSRSPLLHTNARHATAAGSTGWEGLEENVRGWKGMEWEGLEGDGVGRKVMAGEGRVGRQVGEAGEMVTRAWREEEMGRREGELGRRERETGRREGVMGKREGELGRREGETGRREGIGGSGKG
ncbi:unnamed protein product [Closterium sp. Naga37s-1]|nr:unnamed protein product [Closterium sp. Naga37s-1]